MLIRNSFRSFRSRMAALLCDFLFVMLLCLLPLKISAESFERLVGNLKVSFQDEQLQLTFSDKTSLHSTRHEGSFVQLGAQLSDPTVESSKLRFEEGRDWLSLQWPQLSLKLKSIDQNCEEVFWRTELNISMEDCFDLSSHHWYGGPEQTHQFWPIETAVYKEDSYVTKEASSQAIAERYWLNSAGFYIYVDPRVPLFIDQNNHRNNSLCLIAKREAPYIRESPHSLKYTLCKFTNPREAHEHAVKNFLGKPTGVPSADMVRNPIWSTWAKYKININESTVMTFARKVIDNGFSKSHLEIDDKWETCYGSLTIDKTAFPDMKRLTDKLKAVGFKVTIWVHPFVNLDCKPTHDEALAKNYFVKNTKGDVRTPWWNGNGSYIDFTNKDAAAWYETRLKDMLKIGGIDSLKFDAGESSWTPQLPVMADDKDLHPQGIVQAYVRFLARFGEMVETRSGFMTQDLPIFVRMIDRESRWGMKGLGLTTVITTTFQMNLNGYPFVLPDMVGGNAYNNDTVTKEMFIRFLQVNVFLPAIQFSIPPWDYDQETIDLTKKYIALHQQYSDKIIELMKKAVKTGEPINPPIWWIAPTDKTAHGIYSEYLLGEDILVAPVLEKGATQRDIYLPSGRWRDESSPSKSVHSGPVWLKNYPAPLNTLPYFTRLGSGASHLSTSLFLVIITSLLLYFKSRHWF